MKYKCYETGLEGAYTSTDLKNLWYEVIDQSNFSDFDSWLDEMLHMQILIAE